MRRGGVYAVCGTGRRVSILAAAILSVSVRAPAKTAAASGPCAETSGIIATASDAKMWNGGKIATASNACRRDREENKVVSGTHMRNSTTATSSDAQIENVLDEVFLEDDITSQETGLFSGTVPQISVTVPTETVIFLGADGTCMEADSEIQNNSDVPVYLEQVACVWKTNTQTSAEMIFTEWQEQKPYATLILDGGETHQFHPGESGTAVWEDISGGVYTIAAGEALELTWKFSLNENYVTEVLVAEKEVAVATVTYTVSSQVP